MNHILLHNLSLWGEKQMDRGNRPVGREKRVGSGEAEVEKRGDGLSGQTGGPVGNSSGYSDRTESSFGNQSNSSNSNFNNNQSTRMGSTPTGGSKYIVILIVVGIALFFLYHLFNKKPNNATNTPETSTAVTYVDKGPYPVNVSVSNLAREKRTSLIGNGEDKATIMVYMCGTDLESQDGSASSDLNEMLYAEISDKVNIILETGGTIKWQNSIISSKTNQRYRVTNKGLVLLENNLGRKSMVNPTTLTDFIKYCQINYPANRYSLIMWDHGGGSLNGFGYDQHFPNDSMKLDEISTALKNSNCYFDIIGFDACLMGTLETAIVVEPYADYMIASEEAEPGVGWYYKGWITALSQNTSIPSTDLGKMIIDNYVKDVQEKDPQNQATLSLIDLAELKGTVPSVFSSFASSTNKLIDDEKFKTVSDARAGTKEFAPSAELNQIDLIHFAEILKTPEAKSFAEVLRGCIKYNRTSTTITNANGLSIFFPYGKLTMLSPMLDTYKEIGINKEYSECIRSFASVTAGGQIVSGGSNNMLQSLLGSLTNSTPSPSGTNILGNLLNQFLATGDFSKITGLAGNALGWLDVDKIKSYLSYFGKNRIDATAFTITEKDGQQVLALTDKQWDLIQHMEMNVFIDDGKGFIDLGLDNVYEYNDDGDLIMEYDGTWLTLNGHIVSYYMLSDDRHGDIYSTKGRVPAFLNDQRVDIIIEFDNKNPYGIVLGAQIKYDTEKQTDTIAKGLLSIKAGDKIDFLCDYYTYGGKYNDTYYLGKQYIATGTWKIENLSVGKKKYKMSYRFTDIYNNKYWTPSINN